MAEERDAETGPTGTRKATRPADGAPGVVVRKKRRPSAVWLVPIVAAAIGGWLGYRAIMEKGPSITITFSTAQGLQAGKTQIKFRDLVVGTVKSITLANDLSHVILKADMVRGSESILREGTQFWVVRPRIGPSGVTGLNTLISGAYIGVSAGSGRPTFTYKGLDWPPPNPDARPGLRVVLQSDTLGSLNNGSPIYFRGVQVGEIETHTLTEDNQRVDISAFIWEPYNNLVRTNARFWNMSGINVSMGADGLQVQTSTLEALLTGGVAFETPATAAPAPQAPQGARFELYESREAMYRDKRRGLELSCIAYFDDPVRGLNAGAPVALKGIQIGTVTRVRMEFDSSTNSIRTPVTMQLDPDNIVGMGVGSQEEARDIIAGLVEDGLRAQLQTGSLLTGELFVDLNFHPGTQARLIGASSLPELPTIPSKLTELTNRVEGIMARLEGLPLTRLVESAIGVTENARALLARVDPMATNLERTLSNVDKAMASIQSMIAPNSVMRYDLGTALEEAATAMRSIRILASYLERHPDALIYGKFRTGGRR